MGTDDIVHPFDSGWTLLYFRDAQEKGEANKEARALLRGEKKIRNSTVFR